jgi:LmbE family N-acetylglucosaminyl deacetylase
MSRTMLGVWAHPDDEAYVSAGLMARFRQRGDRVVVITATLGQHGTADPATWPPGRLAARREGELHASLAAVGVHELRLLGLVDGRCAEHDMTDEIARHIDEIEPDLIVTFGPEGITGHPDHVAVHRWATDARAEARPGAALWYPTFTPDFHRQWGELNERIGLWADVPEPPCTPRAHVVHSLTLPDHLMDLKFAALRAHESQTAPLIEMVGVSTYREWWRTESFVAAPAVERTRSRRRALQEVCS